MYYIVIRIYNIHFFVIIKGSERDSASPDSTRSSKSSAYESIYDSVETRPMGQTNHNSNQIDDHQSQCGEVKTSVVTDSNGNNAHVSTVVVNNAQSSGPKISCIDSGEIIMTNNG